MSGAQDPFVKVYYTIADDPRFQHVYDNDAALATWLRLLLLADAMWPASAPLPRRSRGIALLIDAGLVEIVSGGRYRIHGMDAERGKRSTHAQAAARSRWEGNPPSNASGNAPSTAQTMPLRTEQNRTTQSRARKLGSNDPRPMSEIIPEIAQRFGKPLQAGLKPELRG